MGFESILSAEEKFQGFSLQQEGSDVYLLWNKVSVAKFPFEEEICLKGKIHSYIELNKAMMDSCKNILVSIMDESTKDAKYGICYYCGKDCQKFCKYVNAFLDKMVMYRWLNYAMKN